MRVRDTKNDILRDQGGFSLIELAIGMMILSLILLPLAVIANAKMQREKIEDTRAFQREMKDAMKAYLVENGRFPCPADITLGPGDSGYGTGACPPAGAPAVGNCAAGICRLPGINTYVDGGGVTQPNTLLSGGVPFADLKIPEPRTLDSWGGKITYVITESFTDPVTFPDLEDGVNDGGIEAEYYDKDTQTLMSYETDPVIRNTQSPYYLFLSHGPTGQGGYSREGVVIQACAPGTTEDSKNCDNDEVFLLSAMIADDARMSATSTTEGNARFYDDVTYPVSTIDGTFWDLGNVTPEDVMSVNVMVGINTDDPEKHLDVQGAVKADTFNLGNICDNDGANCFQPELIMGPTELISCAPPFHPAGSVMVGIANAAADCDDNFTVPGNGSCPSGQFVTGVSAGGVTCGTL